MSKRVSIPLSKRLSDIIFIVFFIINLLFITYVVDFEQIMIPDPRNFTYPIWPPKICVDVIHWWEFNFDPLILERTAWWMTTIWYDVLFFGPFYAVGIYAFIKGKEWIRIPAIIYASSIICIVITILSEEIFGDFHGEYVPLVIGVNLPWLLMPMALLAKMSFQKHPFSEKIVEEKLE